MAAADRREAELAFDRQREDRLARRLGQRRLPSLAILRGCERARCRAELLDHPDAGAGEIDVRPAQSIQLARPQPCERSDLEPGRKRRACQLACAPDQLPDLLLARRLLVPAARPSRYAEPRKRVLAQQSAALRRGGVVEHGPQRRDRAIALATGEPLRNYRVVDRVHPSRAVALDKRPRALAIVDVRGLLRPGKQRIGRPPRPEAAERHGARADIAKTLSRLLHLSLRRKRPGTAQDPRHAHVPADRRVVDLRAPSGPTGAS